MVYGLVPPTQSAAVFCVQTPALDFQVEIRMHTGLCPWEAQAVFVEYMMWFLLYRPGLHFLHGLLSILSYSQDL